MKKNNNKTPIKKILIINLKTYKEGTGLEALKIAKIIQTIQKTNKNIKILLAVQATDISNLYDKTNIDIISQHVDAIDYGSNTGKILPQAIKQAGAIGTIINHSERRLDINTIKKTIELCKKQKLTTILCVKDEKEAEKYTTFAPDFIAVEPPELIGGKKSISEAEPELIKKTLRKTKNIPLLCGAGIHTKEDVSHAINLGANGVLVASGIVKAKNKSKEIKELIDGFLS